MPEVLSRTSVLFVIRSLGYGGAERQLVELVRAIDKRRFEIALATFYSSGGLRQAAGRICGVKLYSLEKTRRWDFQWLRRLTRLVRKIRPDIVIGYISTGHLASLLAGRVAGCRVIWSVRGSDNRESGHYTAFDTMNFRAAGLLSRFSNLLIFNSEAGRKYYLTHGYAPPRSMVIPNGIDTAYFSRCDEAGLGLREKWKIPRTVPLIGLVARLDHVKDHPTFLRAASLLLQEQRNVHFICVGSGPSKYAQELASLAADLGIQDRVHWTGNMDDMPAVYSALDINTLCTTCGEGFPNSVAEAMSCCTPCVVTPAGDSASIVNDTGVVVRARCADEMAAAWQRMLALTDSDKALLRARARQRILSNFPRELMVRRTETALLSVMDVSA